VAVRIFVAGATGVLGIRLVPLLLAEGHEVTGMARSSEKAADLVAQGAQAAVCDVYDAGRLVDVVTAGRPDVVLHQLTDLPDDLAELPAARAANNRIRREGTRNLLDAYAACGTARLFVAQSIAWDTGGDGRAAVEELEAMTLDVEGVVIRYGQFYGPGTFYEDEPPEPPRVHIATAAAKTLPALDLRATTITVVD
jgi:nucleoside-diphosphate-sugar epimerase